MLENFDYKHAQTLSDCLTNSLFWGCSLESRLSLCITRILSLRQKSQTTRDFDRVIKERVITNQERVIITFHHALTNVFNLLEPT